MNDLDYLDNLEESSGSESDYFSEDEQGLENVDFEKIHIDVFWNLKA